MSCGTCANQTLASASAAIGAPTATGVAVRNARADAGADVLAADEGVSSADVLAGTVAFVKANSDEDVAEFIVNLRAALRGAMVNVNSYREAYEKLYRETEPGESQAKAVTQASRALGEMLTELTERFNKQYGPGQFSFRRFADFIVDEEPELSANIIKDFVSSRWYAAVNDTVDKR
jgi:hypothetical protein